MIIVLIEDEWLVARDMEDALTQAGHRVHAHTSVIPALAQAEETHPDLVLTNIHLGAGGDGIDAASQFLQRFGVPSLFVSGSRKEAEAARGLALGILVKPCRAEQIVATVNAASDVIAGREPALVPAGLELFAEGVRRFQAGHG